MYIYMYRLTMRRSDSLASSHCPPVRPMSIACGEENSNAQEGVREVAPVR